MKNKGLFKFIGESIVTVGVGTIVTNVVVATTPFNTSVARRLCIVVGGGVLGSLFSEVACDHAGKKIEEIVGMVNKGSQPCE